MIKWVYISQQVRRFIGIFRVFSWLLWVTACRFSENLYGFLAGVFLYAANYELHKVY